MSSPPTGTRQPLWDVRVADLTQIWAGPYATMFLADMGAQVIKVESIQRPDPERMGPGPRRSRFYPNYEPGQNWFNTKAEFAEYNRNKLGITLDLTTSEGVSFLRSLVSISDVVVENFRAGVMDRLGIGYDALKILRPDIIMLSMSGFGSRGPEAQYGAYGPTQEPLAGLSSITSYLGEPPSDNREYYGDPTGGAFGAASVFAALLYRKRTGQGTYIDLSQREAMIACLPELTLEYAMAGRILGPLGNRHLYKAPHGCYRCVGDNKWTTISIASDAEWQALCRVLGEPGLADDPRFSTVIERTGHQDELDGLIEQRTQAYDHYDLMHRLQAEGIRAQAVLDIEELVRDPQYMSRDYFSRVDQPDAGSHLALGTAWKLSGMKSEVMRPSPGLGEHNRLVLTELLGVSEAALATLAKKRVIGDFPVGY